MYKRQGRSRGVRARHGCGGVYLQDAAAGIQVRSLSLHAVSYTRLVSEAGKMDFIETLDRLSEEAPAEYRKAAAETGGMTVPGLSLIHI